MPRLRSRHEPPPEDRLPPDEHFLVDGLLVEGVDTGAARRARIRALNAARQAAERDVPASPRHHDLAFVEAARGEDVAG
jgi:hypothetical protein